MICSLCGQSFDKNDSLFLIRVNRHKDYHLRYGTNCIIGDAVFIDE